MQASGWYDQQETVEDFALGMKILTDKPNWAFFSQFGQFGLRPVQFWFSEKMRSLVLWKFQPRQTEPILLKSLYF